MYIYIPQHPYLQPKTTNDKFTNIRITTINISSTISQKTCQRSITINEKSQVKTPTKKHIYILENLASLQYSPRIVNHENTPTMT